MKPTAYLIQATLISLWWVGLGLSDDFFGAFQFTGIGGTAFRALLLPDLVVIALASLIRGYRDLPALEYIILGAFAYAALYCVNAAWLTGSGYLPTTIMLLGLAYNGFIIYGSLSFRESASRSFFVNATKTFVQILGVWLITLVVFPYLVLSVFPADPTCFSGISQLLAVLLFILFSTIGLASAYVMVHHGEGTPLPLDQTNKLVIAGPYRYVRNPMAIAGVGQGLAISLYFLSFPLAVYALLGAVLWQLVVRPLEENNLAERFGVEYERYRERVGCWWPGKGRDLTT